MRTHRKSWERGFFASLESKLSFCIVGRLKDFFGYDLDMVFNIENTEIAKHGKQKKVLRNEKLEDVLTFWLLSYMMIHPSR